jgi:hypothetical protein
MLTRNQPFQPFAPAGVVFALTESGHETFTTATPPSSHCERRWRPNLQARPDGPIDHAVGVHATTGIGRVVRRW